MQMKKLVSTIALIAIMLIIVSNALSLTYQIKTQVVSITTSATKLPTTPVVGREYVRIQNIGSATVYLGASTVTADTASTGGLQLLPQASWIAPYDHTVDVYGIVASGTCDVVVEEGK